MEIDAQDLKTLERWVRRFKSSEEYCQPFFDKGKANYKRYRSYTEKAQKPYKHSIFVPYSFAFVEDMAAYFMLSILASPKTFSINPRGVAISADLCSCLEEVLHWALTEESVEFPLELEEVIKNINIFNTGYLINYPQTGMKSEKPFYERYHLDAPATMDIFPEPGVKRLSRANWVIKRSYESFETLKALEARGQYENVDDGQGGFEDENTVTKLLRDIGLDAKKPYADDKGNPEILDCMEDGHVITIMGRRAVIRDTTKDSGVRPFPFKFPILDCRMAGAPGEFNGIGATEAIGPLQDELNLLRCQRRDNVSLLLNKTFWIDLLAGEVDLNTLFSAPGNVIVGSNMKEAFGEVPMTDVTSSSYKESEELTYDMQSATAMWDYARGATPRRRETASGIIRLQQAAQSRNEWMLRKLDYYILQPLARRMIHSIHEYMPQSDFLDIVGKEKALIADEFYRLEPAKITGLFGIMPLTESIASVKEVDMNNFLQAFDRLTRLGPGTVNVPGLVKVLLQKLGQKDVRDIIPKLSPSSQGAVMDTLAGGGGPGGGGGAAGGAAPIDTTAKPVQIGQ